MLLDLTLGVSVDAQVRANTLLQSILDSDGQFFEESKAVLDQRWAQLRCTFGVTVRLGFRDYTG